MTDLQMWSLLVGFGLPWLVAVVQQPRWSDAVRAVVTVVACVVAGLGTAWFNGDLTGRSILSAVLVVLVTALATYRGFWKPTGIAPATERATAAGRHRVT